ncbi:MAG TPA: hypothetical protein VMU11_01740 [Verrucomicrobiae bacterium]|nr:hypothetical protein [Verrucomicrobiae bacterium]
MTNPIRRGAWLAAFAALALAGAGCAAEEPTQPSMPQEPQTPPGQITQPESSDQNMPPASTSTNSVLPVIDDSWKTYANAQLKFSFKYPTKGVYAPTWGVTILKPNDPKLDQGCYQGDANPRQNKGELQVGDTTFCVTRYEDAGAGQRYETDYYVGGLNGQVVLLTFSKHLSVGDNYDDPACHGQLVTNIGNACKPVDLGVYNAALDQIVKTYTHE